MAAPITTKPDTLATEAWDLVAHTAARDGSSASPLEDPFLDGLDLGALGPGKDVKRQKKSKKYLLPPDFASPRILSSALHILPSHGRGEATVDELCRFQFWDRTAYITYCGATLVDFSQFLWLLKHGQPASWYMLPSHRLAQAPQTDGGDLLPQLVSSATKAEPYALTCPRVCVGTALQSVPVAEAQPADLVSPISALGTLRYLSVVQAVHHVSKHTRSSPSYYPGTEHSNADIGVPMFKVVVTGSQEAALTQAYYDAGANGWSTVFTCVVFDHGMVGHSVPDLGPESIRVSSLAALTSLRNRERGVRLVMF